MKKKLSGKPSLIPAFLALFIIIIFGYLIFTDLESTRTEHIVTPPIEIITTPEQLPLTVIDEQIINNEEIIQQEAVLFVENLSPTSNEPIAINEYKDQFVRHDGLLTLPKIERRTTTIKELLADKSLAKETPLTLRFSTEKHTETTLAELRNTLEDHTATITIISSDNKSLSKPLIDIINQHTIDLDDKITLAQTQQHLIKTTLSELASLDIDPSQSLFAELTLGQQEILIKDLIPTNSDTIDALFYLHRVTDQDAQGLWGIIQTGLIDKFRQGLHIEGISQNKELIQAVIPADADEKLSSGLSSFLGKILSSKTDTSYIYNFHTDSMGRDSNLIYPGQQLILIQFSANELSQIYQFFSDKRNQGIETFAITD